MNLEAILSKSPPDSTEATLALVKPPDERGGVPRSGQFAGDPVFDQNPVAMWVYDPHSLRFLAVNDAAVRRYGYTRAELERMTIAEIRPEQDVSALRAAVCSGAVWT